MAAVRLPQLLRCCTKLQRRQGVQALSKIRITGAQNNGAPGVMMSQTRTITESGSYYHENRTMNSVTPLGTKSRKASLVIFDKDGTLICAQSMWSPWARRLVGNIEKATGLDIEDKLYEAIGYCTKSERVIPGVLAEATTKIVKEEIIKLLVSEGIDEKESWKILDDVWIDGETKNPRHLKTLGGDLETLFKILQKNNIKIAVCTSDDRKGTEEFLEWVGLDKYIDEIICGDDVDSEPKPSPYNAYKICKKLNVDPLDTVMVGDTKTDMLLGKSANLGWIIGVLSGIGQTKDLLPYADHVITDIKDLLPLILPHEDWKGCYAYSHYDRILVEPHSLESSTEATSSSSTRTSVDLVVFDLHGTLLCTHSKYSDFMDNFCRRIKQVTGLEVSDKIYESLGMSRDKQKVNQGILAEGTPSQVKASIVSVLREEGLYYEEAIMVVNQIWRESVPILQSDPKSLHKNIKGIFKKLKRNNVKIAVSTGETRDSALSDLIKLGVLKYVDIMVCGDDPGAQSKPSGRNVELICEELDVNPDKTLLIGDSEGDLLMAKAANVNKKIAVLSGVGSLEDLEPYADHVVPTVESVLDFVLEKTKPNSDKPVPNATGNSGQRMARAYSTLANEKRGPFSNFLRRNFSTSTRRYMNKDAATYDYVIVGAGSAGCTLANRITANPDNKVLVLEAGPKDVNKWDSWKIHMPAALMYNLCDDKYNWYYHTEPEKHMNNRVMYWPRGRVFGGSSSLNAMVYIRGHALDYDRWQKEGAEGWSYADCLPYFRKAQTHKLGADDYRGGDGPLHVSRGITDNPLHNAFINAAVEAGYPYTEDMNGYQQEGVGWMDMTIHKGKRWSAASAYLRPALKRPNLTAEVKALTTRILFDKNRAVGIEYVQNGQTKQVRAEKEVILSGGSINSPQLLMLSGIGNADDLRKLDIPVVQHLPGVGENLQDHIEIYFQQECKQPVTLYTAQWKFPHNMIRIGLEWFLRQTGDGATTHIETGGFIRSRPGVEHPDIQYHFLPSTVYDHGRVMGDRHAYQVHVGPMRPTSRGYLKLKSRNPQDHPKIVANYMSTEQDVMEMRACVRLSREIFAQKSFEPFRGPEIQPGSDVQTDAQIDAFNRKHGDSSYHPSCTCKMGSPDDPMTVVDPSTRVLGMEGLRVIDASIMPSVVSGNLNGPTIMIAEKAADIVLGNNPLPRSNAPVYKPKTLETQR